MSSEQDTSKAEAAPANDVYVDPPAAPPAPPRSRSKAALLLASAAVVLTLSAPYWTTPLYRALHLRPPGMEWQARQEVENGRHAQSLAELDRRLADLAGVVAKANDQAAGVKAMQATLEAQTRALAQLQLRAVLRRPVPFDAELKAVRAFGGKGDDLEPLLAIIEPYASTGIPLDPQLRREFSSVSEAVARTEARPSMMHWLTNVTGLGTLTNLVTWSAEPPAPEGPQPARPADIVERAQAKLYDGDLRGAADELAKLEGDAAGAARIWLGEAKARMAANQAVDRIAEHVSNVASKQAK
ncbi:MAG TPA: hypothetical protein VD860_04335 [Azospirillum sp.]|nr:hypothetical protein [Azospirillum sp.]